MKAKVTIQPNDGQKSNRYQRVVKVGGVWYWLEDDDRPDCKTGDVVEVEAVEGDQFARIVTSLGRFVMCVGTIEERLKELGDKIVPQVAPGAIPFWDRQQGEVVALIMPNYAQLICLEHTESAASMPFTNLETWLNALDNKALASEGIPITLGNGQPEYDVQFDREGVAEIRGPSLDGVANIFTVPRRKGENRPDYLNRVAVVVNTLNDKAQAKALSLLTDAVVIVENGDQADEHADWLKQARQLTEGGK